MPSVPEQIVALSPASLAVIREQVAAVTHADGYVPPWLRPAADLLREVDRLRAGATETDVQEERQRSEQLRAYWYEVSDNLDSERKMRLVAEAERDAARTSLEYERHGQASLERQVEDAQAEAQHLRNELNALLKEAGEALHEVAPHLIGWALTVPVRSLSLHAKHCLKTATKLQAERDRANAAMEAWEMTDTFSGEEDLQNLVERARSLTRECRESKP